MKLHIKNIAYLSIVAGVMAITGCSKDKERVIPEMETTDRWFTVSGALMQEEAGDGNGGTQVFAVTLEELRDPNYSIDVFSKGSAVRSSRTARLQASADGKYLYNIQYTGADGGVFNKYRVLGRKNFVMEGPEVETADYVSASPRWLKATEGVGVAVRAAAKDPVFTGTSPNFTYKETVAEANVITLNLNDPQITQIAKFELRLTEEENAAGYYISRIDVPVVNKAGNKVFIGAAVSRYLTTFSSINQGIPVFEADRKGQKSWAKTLVLDYPSLQNPKILTSTKTRGNTNGYRSTMQYVGTDGHVYQATSGELPGTGGLKYFELIPLQTSTTSMYSVLMKHWV